VSQPSSPSGDFRASFGRAPECEACAPGRVNLIGEHTDYSGGFVLPMAIPQTTCVVLAHSDHPIVRAVSDKIERAARVSSFELAHEERRGEWIDYVQGVVVALRARGHDIGGFDMAVASNVPVGSGLSSSAALEVALLRALREAFSLPIDDVDLAKIGRAAETDFVGAPIGIMDQMASSLADASNALFIDTRSLAHERVPLPHDVEVVVIDSGVAHDHATGDYRTRRAECERAAELLGVPMLRDVDDVARVAALPEPLARRARHVVTENKRVLDAVACMRAGDSAALGELLDASHASLRDDFEVSVPAVDRLVAIAGGDADILGARMTGGGFGGAIVALAKRGKGREAAARIVRAYDAGGSERGRALVPLPVALPDAGAQS
jgi:galactokinase